MIEDVELLRCYAEEESETAFAELVRRHLNFVYACALRRVGGDAHLAEDVTQQVFRALARAAKTLRLRESLSGWLYTTARHASAQVVRSERRRHQREATAHFMNAFNPATPRDADWEQLRPVLDDAMDGLSRDDRQAVLLRYFEGKSYADIGARLRLAENTARMRVERALEKLRAALGRRGVTSTTTGLAVALANQAAVAAPAGLAGTVTGAALAGAAGTGGWLATFIGVGKLQAALTGAIAVGGIGAYVWQAEANAELRREVATTVEQRRAMAALQDENQRLAAAAAEVDSLRRDDVELRQLAARVVELKQAGEERARVRAQQQRRRELEEWLRQQDRLAQVEVERLNREGNALVEKFKALSARARDGSLAPDVREDADAAAKLQLAGIQAKQREIKAFTEESKRALAAHQAELRQLSSAGGPNDPPGAFVAANPFELRRAAGDVEPRGTAQGNDASLLPPSPANSTLILRP